MMSYNRDAPGVVWLRDFCKLVAMIAVSWLAIIGTWFMVWLTYWTLA